MIQMTLQEVHCPAYTLCIQCQRKHYVSVSMYIALSSYSIPIPNAGAIFVKVARSCEVYLLSHTHVSTSLTNFISGS